MNPKVDEPKSIAIEISQSNLRLLFGNLWNHHNDCICGIDWGNLPLIAYDSNGHISGDVVLLTTFYLFSLYFEFHLISLQVHIEINTVVILRSLLCVTWAFVLVFSCCELGHKLSDAFDRIDDLLYRIDWYLFPMKIQKMLPIIMLNTQQSLVVKFFGSNSCSREQFKKVTVKYVRGNWVQCTFTSCYFNTGGQNWVFVFYDGPKILQIN